MDVATSENIILLRYKHEIMVDGDPVIFEICDTCTKVRHVFSSWPLISFIYAGSGYK